MIRTAHFAAALAVGVAVGLGAGLAVAPSAASGGGTTGVVEAPASARGDKQDMLVTLTPQRIERERFETPIQVAQVQIHGDERMVILIDDEGRIVYRSDKRLQTTEVSRDAVIPASGPLARQDVEMARIDGAFLRASSVR